MPVIRLRNLTPHTVTFRLPDGRSVDLPPELPTPRCTLVRLPAEQVMTQLGEVPVIRTTFDGGVTDLPDPEPGTWLVVPRAVVEAVPDRVDLVFPDDLVRDPATGQVVACRALGRC